MKTHKQIEPSAHVFFCLPKMLFKKLLLKMQQTALSCRDLVNIKVSSSPIIFPLHRIITITLLKILFLT
jgi:hypothetical protein